MKTEIKWERAISAPAPRGLGKDYRNSTEGGMMTEKRRNLFMGGVLLVGAAFMVLGIMRGEVDVVLRQAITICLECIGIG